MDLGIVGLLVVAAIVAGAVLFGRPKPALPLDQLLARLSDISANPTLTAVQKRHQAEVAYRAYESKTVSVIGVVDDVFPNGSVTMRTSSRELPAVGVELSRVSPDQLRSFMKGKAITLRARLPGWNKFTDIAELAPGLHGAKAFCGGKWYGVKATYKVSSTQAGKQ